MLKKIFIGFLFTLLLLPATLASADPSPTLTNLRQSANGTNLPVGTWTNSQGVTLSMDGFWDYIYYGAEIRIYNTANLSSPVANFVNTGSWWDYGTSSYITWDQVVSNLPNGSYLWRVWDWFDDGSGWGYSEWGPTEFGNNGNAMDFGIDRINPNTTNVTGPSGWINTTSATFNFSCSDSGGSGCSGFTRWFDNGLFGIITSDTFVTYNNLSEGSHTFTVQAMDTAGNVDTTAETRNFQVDSIAPQTTINSGPNGIINTDSATFSFSSNDGAGSGASEYLYMLDGVAGWMSTNSTSVTFNNLSQGTHIFEVKAKDAAGNVGGEATQDERIFQVDSIAPETTITNGPNGLINSNSATFNFTGNDGSGSGGLSYSYKLDTGGWSSYSPTTSVTFNNNLLQGLHVFEVKAKDAAGNEDASAAFRIFTVDTIAPETTITSGPSGTINTNSADFTFSGNDSGGSGGLTFSYHLDGGAWSAYSGATTVNYTGLAAGAHTFEVKAKDVASNEDQTPATRNFSYVVPTSGSQTPGDQTPGGQTPGNQTPGGQTPGGGTTQQTLNTLLSLSAKPKAVQVGKATTIKGQLKDASGKPVAGKVVVIKANGKVIKKIKTNAAGVFQFKHKPKKTTKYQASYAGDGNYKAANSNVVKVKVSKAKKKAKAKKKKR